MDELTKEDVDLLYEEANEGDPNAQLLLGLCYLTGNCLVEDPETALEWIMKAAEQEHPGALELLAEIEEQIARERARENLRRKKKAVYATEEPFEGASQVPLLEDLTEEQKARMHERAFENDYLYHKLMLEPDDKQSDERIAFLDSLDW